MLVTGAASGIGLAACRGFAQLGVGIRAVARDERRAQDAVRQSRAKLLARSAPSRIIDVSSGGMYSQSLPVGDLQPEHTCYPSKRLDASTKREPVVITELCQSLIES